MRPRARAGVVVRAVGDEAVALDTARARTLALDPVAAGILARCDGATTVDELAVVCATPHENVQRTLDELFDAGLVDLGDGLRDEGRRRMMRNVALAGAAGVAVTAVGSVVSPGVAAAASEMRAMSHDAQSLVEYASVGTNDTGVTYTLDFTVWVVGPAAEPVLGRLHRSTTRTDAGDLAGFLEPLDAHDPDDPSSAPCVIDWYRDEQEYHADVEPLGSSTITAGSLYLDDGRLLLTADRIEGAFAGAHIDFDADVIGALPEVTADGSLSPSVGTLEVDPGTAELTPGG